MSTTSSSPLTKELHWADWLLSILAILLFFLAPVLTDSPSRLPFDGRWLAILSLAAVVYMMRRLGVTLTLPGGDAFPAPAAPKPTATATATATPAEDPLLRSDKARAVWSDAALRSVLSLPVRFTPWLCTAGLQTGYVVISELLPAWLVGLPSVVYDRQLLQVKAASTTTSPTNSPRYDGVIGLDWVVSSSHPWDAAHFSYLSRPVPRAPLTFTATTPTVILLPGVVGHSRNSYIRQAVHRWSQTGLRCVVVNVRGCGGVKATTPEGNFGVCASDVTQAIVHIRTRLPLAALFLVGYSLGAMVATRYLAEKGDSSPLQGAAILSSPWTLHAVSAHIHSTAWRRLTMSLPMALSWKAVTRKHAALYVNHPTVDLPAAYRSWSVREFDTHFTSKAAGFDSVDEYYTASDTRHMVKQIRVTTLAISARDDPVCGSAALPVDECAENESVQLLVTGKGGHSLSWFEGWTAQSWSARAVETFIAAVLTTDSAGEAGAAAAVGLACS